MWKQIKLFYLEFYCRTFLHVGKTIPQIGIVQHITTLIGLKEVKPICSWKPYYLRYKQGILSDGTNYRSDTKGTLPAVLLQKNKNKIR